MIIGVWFIVWFDYFFFQAEDGIRDIGVTGVQTCALPIYELFAGKMINHDMGLEMGVVLDRIAEDHPDGGRILYHTADAYIYCAVAEWVAAQNETAGPAWDMHVVTPYEPKLMPGFALKGVELHQSLLALGRMRGGRVSVFFWTETARLAEFYRRAYSMVTNVLELPTPQWAIDPAQTQPLRDGKLVMLFLGAAREEKGFLHLPALAAEIAARPGLGDQVVMRLHCSAPVAGFSKTSAGGGHGACALIYSSRPSTGRWNWSAMPPRCGPVIWRYCCITRAITLPVDRGL